MSINSTIPSQALQEIFQKNLSGCLAIADPRDKSVSWKLYLNSNRIHYGTSAVGQSQRIDCLWQQFQPNLTAPKFVSENFDYQQLCNWWMLQKLPHSDLEELVFKITQEALAQIITFDSTSIKFFPDRSITPVILNYSCSELLRQTESLSHQWQQLQSHIVSPFARIYIDATKFQNFYNFWKQIDEKTDEHKFFRPKKLSFWFKLLYKKPTIYQLANQINVDPLTVAKNFYNLVKIGIVEVFPFEINNDFSKVKEDTKKADANRPIIACIDDSRTVQNQVKLLLESSGYQVLSITNPGSSLTTMIRQKPQLILMDINMPEIDGYKLCQMLSRSRKLKDIPVVMLTGRDGMVDKIRSKMVGAVYYLTKPFEPHQLVEVVECITQNKPLNKQDIGVPAKSRNIRDNSKSYVVNQRRIYKT